MSAFSTLSDDRLLAELHALVRDGWSLEARLLRHLGEVDSRRLYRREACSSMFRYCVEVLRFSEASAFKRIAAARAARQFPELLVALECGELHVTAVRLLAPHLDSSNAGELISLAKHRTAEQIKRLLADLHPKEGVAASVRRVARRVPATDAPSKAWISLPEQGAAGGEVRGEAVGRKSLELEPQNVESAGNDASGPRPDRPAFQPARPTSEPLGGDRYCIRFSAGPETHAQLRELQALLRHRVPSGDIGEILGRAVAMLHVQARKQKFADCDKPRRTVERTLAGSSERDRLSGVSSRDSLGAGPHARNWEHHTPLSGSQPIRR
jgi:hypothetical protein